MKNYVLFTLRSWNHNVLFASLKKSFYEYIYYVNTYVKLEPYRFFSYKSRFLRLNFLFFELSTDLFLVNFASLPLVLLLQSFKFYFTLIFISTYLGKNNLLFFVICSFVLIGKNDRLFFVEKRWPKNNSISIIATFSDRQLLFEFFQINQQIREYLLNFSY